MRAFVLWLGGAALLLTLVRCDEPEAPPQSVVLAEPAQQEGASAARQEQLSPPAADREAVARELEELQGEVDRRIQQLDDAADQASQELRQRLVALRGQLERMEERAERGTQEALARLEPQLRRTKRSLQRMQQAAGEGWREAERDLERLGESLEAFFTREETSQVSK